MKLFARAASAIALMTSLATAQALSAPTEPAPVEQVQGTGGWLSRFVCVGCAAGFLAASGTGSIVAVALVAGAMPEAAMGCALACIDGFALE